ncbi:EKC/KEOPS complex subunit Tprkb-like [Anneissia japonica]|uniref:EKC/KEOPS complex subunit Tprkb-like n=1 Tax=Anneissia japonica TaxID=1529436 RepID=UPI001425B2C3|nr:EKC/KEOPS complex subunit Tprkb-like [Anneissia japonica]
MEFIQKFNVDAFAESSVSLALFGNVKNAEEIKKHIGSGNIDAAIVSPVLVADAFQVLVATNKAIYNQKNGKLKTRSVNSEILYSISPSKNIGESFKLFSFQNDASHLLVVVLNDESNDKFNVLQKRIVGDLIPLENLKEISDIDRIKQVYKIPDEELKYSSLVQSVVSRIATKDVS